MWCQAHWLHMQIRSDICNFLFFKVTIYLFTLFCLWIWKAGREKVVIQLWWVELGKRQISVCETKHWFYVQVSAFYNSKEKPQHLVRFCFCKNDEKLQKAVALLEKYFGGKASWFSETLLYIEKTSITIPPYLVTSLTYAYRPLAQQRGRFSHAFILPVKSDILRSKEAKQEDSEIIWRIISNLNVNCVMWFWNFHTFGSRFGNRQFTGFFSRIVFQCLKCWSWPWCDE